MRQFAMLQREFDHFDRSHLRQIALQRWDNEGGAGPGRLPAGFSSGEVQSNVPPLGNAELVQLQIRVIALENLVITLLADASVRQLALARDMAAYITPRPGHTAHRLTIHAASEMISLLERAAHFRITPP
jgi:hypothetical protein